MIFKIHVRDSDGRDWWEDYDKDVEDPNKWAEEILARFNAGLRPGEKARELLDVVVIDSENNNHAWVKRTDGQSVLFRGQIVDLHYCSKCRITGKRYGLASKVIRDSKYRAKKYDKCISDR